MHSNLADARSACAHGRQTGIRPAGLNERLERVRPKPFFLRIVDFPSKEKPAERLMAFVDEWNETCAPVPLDYEVGGEDHGEVPKRRPQALGHGRIRFPIPICWERYCVGVDPVPNLGSAYRVSASASNQASISARISGV